jgi:glycosyltransferase involved in cell wall biosynthesis
MYSFCERSSVEADPLAVLGAQPVYATEIPVVRKFLWASKQATADAELAFAQSSLISCHSFYRYHTLWMNQMFRKYKTPYWFVPHGILDPWVMEYGRVAKSLFWKLGGQRFLENASTVICSTQAEKEKAQTLFDLPSADVVPWPVELVDRSNSKLARMIIRAELGISSSDKALVYFGRLHHMKRPLETIRAVAMADRSDVHLIIVGNEQTVSLEECYQVAKECGIESRVHLVGAVYGQRKFDYLFASDGYVSLSFRENFNHTAAESLSAGIPAILSKGNDLYSEIAAVDCAWHLSDDRLETAASVIAQFGSLDHEALVQMGSRGRSWVESNLQFETFLNRLQQLATKYGKT